MVKNIAILSAGILIGYLLLRQSGALISDSAKPGDKSKDIEGMQKALEAIGNMRFDQYGQYDSDTLAAVQYLMEGTSALNNAELGFVDQTFVSDLSKIYTNAQKLRS